MKQAFKNLLRLALPVIVAFALIDLALFGVTRHTRVLEDVVDIQTPATLYAKLDYLRAYSGRRIVFIGDSVVYGRRMEEKGDDGWRAHTIPAAVASLIEARSPKAPVVAMNLAMNGALPADIEQVARLIAPLKPDCIVADISLRAFSADFAPEASRLSRSWLASMQLDANRKLTTETGPAAGMNLRLETTLRDWAINHWQLYQLRDFVQWRVFDGEPASLVRRFRAWLDGRLSGKSEKTADPLDDILLTLKTKNRHDSITLDAQNPQVAALRRTLDRLANDKQCTVFFYATEDRAQLPELIELSRYKALQAELAQIFAGYAGRGIIYIPPLETLEPKHYLDYGHLNEAGSAIVARAIVDGGLGQAVDRAAGKP